MKLLPACIACPQRGRGVRCPGESLPAFGGFRQLASPSPEAKAFCGQPDGTAAGFKVNEPGCETLSRQYSYSKFYGLFEALIKTCDIQLLCGPSPPEVAYCIGVSLFNIACKQPFKSVLAPARPLFRLSFFLRELLPSCRPAGIPRYMGVRSLSLAVPILFLETIWGNAFRSEGPLRLLPRHLAALHGKPFQTLK